MQEQPSSTPPESSAHCISCGNVRPATSRFCPYCGARQEASPASPPVVTPTASELGAQAQGQSWAPERQVVPGPTGTFSPSQDGGYTSGQFIPPAPVPPYQPNSNQFSQFPPPPVLPYQQMPYAYQPQFAPTSPAARRQSRAPIIITGLIVLMTIVAIAGFLLIGMGVVSLGPTLANSTPGAAGKDQPAAKSSGNQQVAPDAQITNNGVPLSAGSSAPDFSLPGIDGRTYTLSSFKGRLVVLEFIATWCPHCQNDAPMMNQLDAAYKSRGVQILAINATVYGHTYEQTGSQAPATMSDLQWFHDTFSVSFPLLFDKELKSANDYQVASYPTIYIVDQNGNIGFQPVQGRVPNYSTLAAALDRLLAAPASTNEPAAATPAATTQAQGQAGSTATYMVITTAKGKIVCKLYTDPSDGVSKTVANFVSKARDGYFNGLTFHRVEDWLIQGGDPLGNGTGGGSMPAEYNNISFGVGALGVARGIDPAINNDSQFFIVKDASSAAGLVGQYTNFGQVVQGMDVVNKISIGDKIISITIQSQNP